MWYHASHKGKTFKGDYELQKDGTTRFQLMCNEKPKNKPIKFRSWQEAKFKKGWVYVKHIPKKRSVKDNG